MPNPFQTSAQYDDFLGRIAIDECNDAGHSSDLLRFAAKAVEMPAGYHPVGITFAGPPAEIEDNVQVTVIGVSDEFVEKSIHAAIEAEAELPCERFTGLVKLSDLLQQMKRLRVSIYPKAFSNGNFTGHS